MDYSQALSQVEDSEITIRVGESFGWNAYFLHPDGSVTFRDDKGRLKGKKNYCHDPADAWPIIFGNLISVEPDYEFIDPSEDEAFASGLWIAEHFDGKTETVRHADPSPLRAAMVVFLMMQDKADANS